MNVLDVNFVARQASVGPAGLCALLLAAAALAASLWHYERARGQTAQLRAHSAAQARVLALRAQQDKTAPMSPAQSEQVGQAIAALNVPWPELLTAIEASRPADVSLVALQPRPAQRTIAITAQSKNMSALLDFMQALAVAAPFEAVSPLRQQAAQTDAGDALRRATFEARWTVRASP